jgi:AbrB family looped-hinge helix DNA binding protein
MDNKVTINERGEISIPEPFRRAYGLKANDELILSATESGILVRPVFSEPLEIYSEARIAQFLEDDAAISRVLTRVER